MPETARTVSRLYLYLIGAVVVIGALVIAVIALVYSNRVGGCVNRVLGERATATQIEQTARYLDAVAELNYERGRGSKSTVIHRKAEYVVAQRAAAAYRAAHPAGRC